MDQVGDRPPRVRVARPAQQRRARPGRASDIAATSVHAPTRPLKAASPSWSPRARAAASTSGGSACDRLPGRRTPRRSTRSPAPRRRPQPPRPAPAGARAGRARCSPSPAVARAGSLDALREAIGDCRRCKLAPARTNLVFGVGNPQARLMFVGEGPGADEDATGEPFVGRAGQLLTEIITKGMRLAPRGRLHRQRHQVPAAGQPQSGARRDRVLRAVPPAPARADPAGGDRRARQVRGADAAANEDADHAAARPLVRLPRHQG